MSEDRMSDKEFLKLMAYYATALANKLNLTIVMEPRGGQVVAFHLHDRIRNLNWDYLYSKDVYYMQILRERGPFGEMYNIITDRWLRMAQQAAQRR